MLMNKTFKFWSKAHISAKTVRVHVGLHQALLRRISIYHTKMLWVGNRPRASYVNIF